MSMKFLFFSENAKAIESTKQVLQGSSHVITHVDLTLLTELDNLDDFDAVLVDKKTWQRCAAIMKYFGILDMINTKPLMVLATTSKSRSLKFRDSQEQSIFCGFPITQEDFNFAADKLFSAQVEV